jgi:hypothetical protein
MISQNEEMSGLGNSIVTRLKDSLNTLTLELLANKTNPTEHPIDLAAIRSFIRCVTELRETTVSQYDEKSLLLSILRESKSLSKFAEKPEPEESFLLEVRALGSDVVISDIRKASEKLRVLLWPQNSARQGLLFLGAK